MLVARQILAIPEEKLDIARAALMLSQVLDSETDIQRGVATVDSIVERVRTILGGRTDPDLQIRAINTVIYREQKFAYDTSDPMGRNIRNQYFWGYLTRRKGNCLTMPTLWYAVADRLGLPVKAVMAPQHTFLRYEADGFRSNIETTTGGGEMADEQVIQDLKIPRQAIASGNMMRSISKREFIMELVVDYAARLRSLRDLGTARALAQLVLSMWPTSMAAHYNLAVLNAELAAASTAVKPVSAKDADAARARAKHLAKLALSHAREATALGAVPPLGEGYWKNQNASRLPERSGPLPIAPPFELERYLQPGGAPIMLDDRVGLLPSWVESRHLGFPTPGELVRQCASICGPSPGNFCIELSRAYR